VNDSLLGQVIILSLATWRISSLLHSEDGPWDVMKKLRKFFGIIHDEDGEPIAFPSLLSWMDCFWCVCLFVGLLISTIWCIMRTDVPECQEWFVIWMGSSAVSILVEKWLGRSKARLWK